MEICLLLMLMHLGCLFAASRLTLPGAMAAGACCRVAWLRGCCWHDLARWPCCLLVLLMVAPWQQEVLLAWETLLLAAELLWVVLLWVALCGGGRRCAEGMRHVVQGGAAG